MGKCVCGGGGGKAVLMWCSGGMRGPEPLQVENFIQFKHSISFIDRLQRGGNARREDKKIRWIHLNMLWKRARLTDIELCEAEMALLIRWKWYLLCAYNSQKIPRIYLFIYFILSWLHFPGCWFYGCVKFKIIQQQVNCWCWSLFLLYNSNLAHNYNVFYLLMNDIILMVYL